MARSRINDDAARRCLSVFAGAALMASVGSNHSISAWNAQLRALLGYSQADISLAQTKLGDAPTHSVAQGLDEYAAYLK